MKFRKVIFTSTKPAPPTIHNTPSTRVQMASRAPLSGRITIRISATTAISEATVALGPSCRMERIMAAKTTALPDVSTVLWYSGTSIRCSTRAMRRRSSPFQTEIPRGPRTPAHRPMVPSTSVKGGGPARAGPAGSERAGRRGFDLGQALAVLVVTSSSALSFFSFADRLDHASLRAWTSGVPGARVDGDHLADDVAVGRPPVLAEDGGLDRLHLADVVGQHDVGLGSVEQRALAGSKLLASSVTLRRAFSRRKSYSKALR
jgi:hypothetical protein